MSFWLGNSAIHYATTTIIKTAMKTTFEIDSFHLHDGTNAVGIGIALGDALGPRCVSDYTFYFWAPDWGDRPEFLGQWDRWRQRLMTCDHASLPPGILGTARAFWNDASNAEAKAEWISWVYRHHRPPVKVPAPRPKPKPKAKQAISVHAITAAIAVDTKFRPAKVGKFTFESR